MSFSSYNSSQVNTSQNTINFSNAPKFEAKAKAVYEEEKQPEDNDSGLNPAEAAIFFKLVAKEDSELQEKLKTAYRRSLIVETEVPEIKNEKEFEIFLSLVEAEVKNTGCINDSEWQAKARDIYESDRYSSLNQRVIKQREILEQATSNIDRGYQKMQDAIKNDYSTTDLLEGCSLLIRGSYGLLSLVEKYHYPKQNWLKKTLAKKLPMLNYVRFRREERIKQINYVLDYLQQFVVKVESKPNQLQIRRLQSYLTALPLEVTYLNEWLTEQIERQERIKNE